MYASKPATQADHGSPTDPPLAPQPPNRSLPYPGEPGRADEIATGLSHGLRNLPFDHMYAFSLTLARDLLHREDPASVIRVAEALLATAEAWRPPE